MIAFLLIAFLFYKLIHYHSNLNDPVNTSIESSFKVFLLVQHVFMVLFILFAIVQLFYIIAKGHMVSLKNIREGTSRKYWQTVEDKRGGPTDGFYYFYNPKLPTDDTNPTWTKPQYAQ